MPLYECVLIARQDIPASQAEGLANQFADIVRENGGEVGKIEYWGLKSLAYRIKKNRKGHYALLNVDAPAPAVAEMERRLGLHEDVLRYLTLKVEEHETAPSAMMQARSSRDGGRRGDRDRGDRDRGDRDRDRGRDRDRDRGDRGERGERSDRGERGDRQPAATPAAAPAATPAAEEEGAST
jgi:small subunit ribosomal protein S6